jgi:hypothetical protein
MNVIITDTCCLHVCFHPDGVFVNVYRMFDAVLVIFTKAFIIIPYSNLHGVQNETKPVSS